MINAVPVIQSAIEHRVVIVVQLDGLIAGGKLGTEPGDQLILSTETPDV